MVLDLLGLSTTRLLVYLSVCQLRDRFYQTGPVHAHTRKWTPTGSGKGKEGERNEGRKERREKGRKEGNGSKLVMFDVKAWMHEFEYE